MSSRLAASDRGPMSRCVLAHLKELFCRTAVLRIQLELLSGRCRICRFVSSFALRIARENNAGLNVFSFVAQLLPNLEDLLIAGQAAALSPSLLTRSRIESLNYLHYLPGLLIEQRQLS